MLVCMSVYTLQNTEGVCVCMHNNSAMGNEAITHILLLLLLLYFFSKPVMAVLPKCMYGCLYLFKFTHEGKMRLNIYICMSVIFIVAYISLDSAL